MSRRAPPSGAAPISLESVAIVKKKLAAPKGPPPAGLAGFKPKALPERETTSYTDDKPSRYDRKEPQYRYDEDDDRSEGQSSSHSRDDEDASPEPKYRPSRDRDRDEPSSVFASAMQSAKATSGELPGRSDAKAGPPPVAPKPSSSSSSSSTVSQPTQLVPGSLLPQYIDRTKKPTIFNFTPILKVTYRELRAFVLSPAQPGVVVRCYIERDRSGMNMFSPVYSLCADLEDGTGRELLACRKVLQSRLSHYVFSLKSEDLWRKREQRSRLYLGKLRSTSANEYVLYDNGTMSQPAGTKDRSEDEEREDAKQRNDGESLYRKELCVIWLNSKTRPAPAGVRGTEICIPGSFLSPEQLAAGQGLDAKTKAVVSKASTSEQLGQYSSRDLVNPFARIRGQGKQNVWNPRACFVMHERTSRYDPLSSCLVDFKGRANMASVKNCQFVESGPQDGSGDAQSVRPDEDKDFILQLGKTTEDCFNMDYTYPLSLLQAFAICVARFDAKVSW